MDCVELKESLADDQEPDGNDNIQRKKLDF